MSSNLLRHFIRKGGGLSSVRFLSMPTPASSEPIKIDKDALMKLRKRTGYSYVNCRKALVQFGSSNLEEAEKWLKELARKEGWAKAAKLGSRVTTQGLMGVRAVGSVAAIVELNCETDFVARGDNFKALLETLTTAVFDEAKRHSPLFIPNKIAILEPKLDDVCTTEGKSLNEVVAMTVGKLGENISVRSIKTLYAPEGSEIFSSAHPKEGTDAVNMGKFVSVIALRRIDAHGLFPTKKLAAQLCQHVIGMRSESLGEPPKIKKILDEKQQTVDDNDELNDFFQGKTTSIDEEETALLRQAFMLNPSQSVYEYVTGHQAEIIDFFRSELGEKRDE